MSDFAWLIFEIFVNLNEAIIIYLFLKNMLGVRQNFKIIAIIGIFLDTGLTTLLNKTVESSALSLIILTTFEVIYANVCFKGPFKLKTLYGFIPGTIFIIGNMVVILFLHLIAPNRFYLETEQSGIRILLCIFYISICYIMCLFLIKDTASRKKRNDFANYILSYIAVILIISVEAHILDLLLTRAGNNVNSNLLIIASIVIAVILVTIIVANSVSENEKRLNQEKDRLLERKELKLLNAKQVSETYEMLRMWRHDTKNHLMIMKELVMNKDYDSLKKIP